MRSQSLPNSISSCTVVGAVMCCTHASSMIASATVALLFRDVTAAKNGRCNVLKTGALQPAVRPEKGRSPVAHGENRCCLEQSKRSCVLGVCSYPCDAFLPKPPRPQSDTGPGQIRNAQAAQLLGTTDNCSGHLAATASHRVGACPDKSSSKLVDTSNCPRRETECDGGMDRNC